MAVKDKPSTGNAQPPVTTELELRVRRIHRRDLNRVWEFLIETADELLTPRKLKVPLPK